MKLIAKDKHNKKRPPSEVIGITRDGWVLTKDGAFGDVNKDCVFILDMKGVIKEFRKKHGLSQQELGWMFGKTRQTIMSMEKGRDMSLKEFFILSSFVPDNVFQQMKKDFKSI